MKKLLKVVFVPALIAFCAIGLFACDQPISYDMSQVTLENKTVVYNGLAQTLEIAGQLPEGVSVNYEYYSENAKLESAPTDAGQYKVVAKFSSDAANYVEIESKEATLTITKALLNVPFGATEILGIRGEKESLATPKEFKNNNDGTFTFEYDEIQYYVGLTNSNAIDYNISLYSGLNEDGSVNQNLESDGLIVDVGVPVYALVEYNGSDENILKNYQTTGIFKIMATKRTFNIYNAADLAQIKTDVEARTYKYRLNTIYNLMNDIDLADGEEKGLWIIPAPFEPKETGKNFCSEFNGNGHTIKNFKITNESIPSRPFGCGIDMMIGFFGFVTDSYIHNLNLSDFDVDVDVNTIRDLLMLQENASIEIGDKVFFGMVAAEVEDTEAENNNIMNTYLSKFENIKVENGNIKIHAADMAFCGIMVGSDNTGEQVFDEENQVVVSFSETRNNLDAKNVVLYVLNSHSGAPTDGVFRMGGLVGEVGKRGYGVGYTDCDLENVKILGGAHDDASQAEVAKTINIGAFVGHNRSNSSYTNCHISNFVIATYGKTNKKPGVGMEGYVGKNKDNSITPELIVENCSHTSPKTAEEIGVETTTGLLCFAKDGDIWTKCSQKSWKAAYEPKVEETPQAPQTSESN